MVEVCSVPEPKGEGVLIKVKSVGICGSDLHLIDSGLMNVTPGHEIAGVTSSGVNVAIEPMLSCGVCIDCGEEILSITVFAPTDDAFAKLPEGMIESLLKPENKDKLKNILLYHVVSGEVMAETAITLDSAKTLQGSSFSINLDGKTLKIDGASVTQADIKVIRRS